MKVKSLVTLGAAAALFSLMLFPAACSKTYTLAPLTAAATPTPTPSANPNGPVIVGLYYQFAYLSVSSAISYAAIALISSSTNSPITNASVTIILPAAAGGNFPLPYINNYTWNAPSATGIPSIDGGYYGADVLGYQGGSACTLVAVVNGTTYTQSFTALNASPGAIASGSSGVTFTLTSAGNADYVGVYGNDVFTEGPPLSSPYILPAADFPLDPAGAGNDEVELDLFQVGSGAFPGSNPKSVCISGAESITFY